MVLKSKDDITPQLTQLEELLRLRLSARQVVLIEQEIALVKAGFRAESKAAFEIDFRLKNHKGWVIIHDLRIEHKGRVAQIDHLVFFPTWEFYVVETKGIHTKVRIEDDQWSFVQNNHWRGMANPVEQNARYIEVLRELFRDLDLLPRTIGLPAAPRFVSERRKSLHLQARCNVVDRLRLLQLIPARNPAILRAPTLGAPATVFQAMLDDEIECYAIRACLLGAQPVRGGAEAP